MLTYPRVLQEPVECARFELILLDELDDLQNLSFLLEQLVGRQARLKEVHFEAVTVFYELEELVDIESMYFCVSANIEDRIRELVEVVARDLRRLLIRDVDEPVELRQQV